MKLESSSFVEHRSRSTQPALVAFGAGTGAGMLAPGGTTCTLASCCSCSCGAAVRPQG